MKKARQVAVEALMKVDAQGGYSPIVLDNALKRSEMDARDKGFVTAMFYGVIERKLTLDHFIHNYAQHKLTPVVREILRLAFYQLIYMKNIPESAVVDEAVELTRLMRQPGAARMVNGILRSFLRQGVEEAPDDDSLAALEIKYSTPKDLIALLIEWYGLDTTKAILAHSFGRPPIYLRANTLKTAPQALIATLQEQGFDAEAAPIEACVMLGGGDIAATALHKKGQFHIQDISSQRAALTLAPKPGHRVLDLCAAPGSKSFTMAQLMQNQGEILCCDIHEHKLPLIQAGADRLGIEIITAKLSDATTFDAALGEFDRVLCDVPCSGLGILRRKPEIKYKPIGSFATLPEYQYKILKNSTNYLKIGGELVYSTCTINPQENQQVVSRLLGEDSRFEPVAIDGESWYCNILPSEGASDGFFISKIRRVR